MISAPPPPAERSRAQSGRSRRRRSAQYVVLALADFLHVIDTEVDTSQRRYAVLLREITLIFSFG